MKDEIYTKMNLYDCRPVRTSCLLIMAEKKNNNNKKRRILH